jgi:cyanophycinase
LIIDQHFRQRDRIGRLLMFVASNPGLLGVGVDEDTAALIDHDGILEVLGRHSVTIVDGPAVPSTFSRWDIKYCSFGSPVSTSCNA